MQNASLQSQLLIGGANCYIHRDVIHSNPTRSYCSFSNCLLSDLMCVQYWFSFFLKVQSNLGSSDGNSKIIVARAISWSRNIIAGSYFCLNSVISWCLRKLHLPLDRCSGITNFRYSVFSLFSGSCIFLSLSKDMTSGCRWNDHMFKTQCYAILKVVRGLICIHASLTWYIRRLLVWSPHQHNST